MPTARKSTDSTDSNATATIEATEVKSEPTPPPQVTLETDDMNLDRSALSSEVDPDAPPEEWCLFLYDPLAAGRGKYSEHSITIPVSVTLATQRGQLNTYDYLSIAKGLQRIRKRDAELIMKCQAKPFRDMCQRNIIRFWSDEWELSKMTEHQALESIRRCEQKTLIEMWMEKRNQYTRPIQEDLDKRKQELDNPPNLQQI